MIERKIIIGLITSTEFCQEIKSMWDPSLLESSTARKIAMWCWEYFEEYEKAPGNDFKNIYYTKLKEGKIPKDLAEEFETEILPELSEEFESEEFNLEYLVKETEKYLADRHIAIHADSIKALQTAGRREEAEKLALEFKPLSTSKNDLDKFILSVKQIREKKTPKPPLLIKPWLRAGQTTILYGNFGTGKSLLTILIAYLLGLEDASSKDCEIDTWSVRQSTGTLYIDGEIGEVEMEERVSGYQWLGAQEKKYRMRILCVPEYQMETQDTFYLSSRVNQLKIIKWLKEHHNYKLIILDSASTLFGLEDENSNSEWNAKINPFLRDLRALGVACLLLHHSGKEEKRGVRGSSATGAMAHNIFRIVDHADKNIDKGEAWFTIYKDKKRTGGVSFKTFSIRFFQSEDGKETHWEITDNY